MAPQEVAASLVAVLAARGGVRVGVRDGSRVAVTLGDVTATGTAKLSGWAGSVREVPVELDGTGQYVVVPEEIITVTER